MKIISEVDRAAKKVMLRGVLAGGIIFIVAGIALLAVWGVAYAIDGSYDRAAIIISFAPILIGLCILVLYLRDIYSSDGKTDYDEFEFGKTMYSVRSVRHGRVYKTADVEYKNILKVKRRGQYLLVRVRGGTNIISRAALGEYEKILLSDIAVCTHAAGQ